jgi:hypothetical protein
MLQMPLSNSTDLCARGTIISRQPKKIEDLIQRKTQIAASPDKAQPPYMLMAKDTVIPRAS